MSPDSSKTSVRRFSKFFVWLLVIAPLLVIFAPVLLTDRSFAFRDTAVFYYPLLAWIEQQWQAGELPLWNPHVNYGTPLVGEASSSLFYPGKLILLLPMEFSWKFKLYVVGHALLAAIGAYWAARKFGTSREAAALAAISYACGGAVLFQYCNVVYLVGAAWLPLAFAATERMVAKRSLRAAVGLGIVLAMMTLGGDPQMAYHVALAAGGYAVVAWWMRRSTNSATDAQVSSNRGRRFGLLGLAGGVAFVLAAVQIFPAAEASKLSDRAAYHAPRSVYEATRAISTKPDGPTLASQGLFQLPEPNTHAASIYEFSFAPWHLAEYVWPGCSGQYFPQYRRWMMYLPMEPRMWSPSVYLGLLPLLLAVASLRLRHGDLHQQWLSWCAVLAILGSFGAFGVGWLLRQPLYGLEQYDLAEKLPGDQVGGVYWFLVTFLPGYAYFRFPAKLLTFAAWPLCLLAAMGLDRLRQHDMPRLRLVLLTLAGLSGVLLLILLLNYSSFDRLTQEIPSDSAYGPFDTEGAYRGLLRSLLHTLLLATLLSIVLARRAWLVFSTGVSVLVALTAIDLVVANAAMIATAPSRIWRERPVLADVLENDRAMRGEQDIPLRVRPPLEIESTDPNGWQATSSPHRIEQLAAADRHAMHTNHCLAGPIDAVDSLASQRLADYKYWFERFHKNEESYWGNYWLMPREVSLAGIPNWQAIESTELEQVAQVKVFRHRQPFPRAWIVHDVTVLPPLTSRDPHVLSARGAEIVEVREGTKVRRRDFRREAVVEYDGKLSPRPMPVLDETAAKETCRIVASEPNRVVVEANLQAAGLLVLGDTYYPGWTAWREGTAESERTELPILRTNRCFRGVLLEAGPSRITFEYVPKLLYWGAAISGLGWGILAVLAGLNAVYAGVGSRNRC
jgi:hypothetical protein